MPDETIIREINIELAELRRDVDSRMAVIQHKLKLALGDVAPPKIVSEFVSWQGKRSEIKQGGRRVGRKRQG